VDLLGTRFEILGLDARAAVHPRAPKSEFKADLKFLGRVIYSQELTPPNGEAEWSNDKLTFAKSIDAQKIITVGPVPLRLSAKAEGKLGLEAKIKLTLGSLAFELVPFSSFKVTASVAVTAVVADAGVKGEVTLVEIKNPGVAKAALELSTDKRQLKGSLELTLQLELSGPKGELSLFVDLCPPPPPAKDWKDVPPFFKKPPWHKYLPELKWPFWKFETVKFELVLAAWRAETTIAEQ
jgi:hypothetical protein